MPIDTHNHLDLAAFDGDRDAVLTRARAAGVTGHLIAGIEPGGWARQRALAAAHAEVEWSAGLHPMVAVTLSEPGWRAALDALPAAFDGPHPACALGELGLDRRLRGQMSLAEQGRVFRAQLAVARALDVPVVLHVVGAHGAALDILRRDGVPRRGGVVHSYSGSAELVPDYTRLGLCLSFAGPVTRATARKVHRAVAAVPAERLMVETDAPDQPPEGAPARNEPHRLFAVAAAVAALRGEGTDAVLTASDRNAETLFGAFASVSEPVGGR